MKPYWKWQQFPSDVALNSKHEIPAFAEAASRRQAKFETKMLNPKLETLNSKQTQMSKTQSKPYYLENIRQNCREVILAF